MGRRRSSQSTLVPSARQRRDGQGERVPEFRDRPGARPVRMDIGQPKQRPRGNIHISVDARSKFELRSAISVSFSRDGWLATETTDAILSAGPDSSHAFLRSRNGTRKRSSEGTREN